ncbi:hypothetical protein HIC20_01540 [Buchnera aphidicola (Hormaphis cornu)]|nr:hypothetical protein HIC20_01540 [Buchnera aphidicola (Hormaphis cornu)]
MFNTLNTEFEFYNKILNLRSLQEEVIASNVANSDTPHYKSKKN